MRDLRLDIFRGIANWGIFLNHIPYNIVSLFMLKNFGFSDFADLFIFVSGYTAALVYTRIMNERGFIAGAARMLRRSWQIYATHIFLLAFYVAIVGAGARNYGIPPQRGPGGAEYNIGIFVLEPVQTLGAALSLRYFPMNLDILPLYVVFMMLFPMVLWAMVRRPDWTLLASVALYASAKSLGWNLHNFKGGGWYFNPFAWQLLFVIGAWCALGGARRLASLIRARVFVAVGVAYLAFALIVRSAELYPALQTYMPEFLIQSFIPTDKSHLPPYRLVHFLFLAAFTARFIPRGAEYLQSAWFKPARLCGQKSLEVFALGLMLSYMAHFYLKHVDGSILSQISVSLLGVAIMTAFAYMLTRWKSVEAANAPSVSAPARTSMPSPHPEWNIASLYTESGAQPARARTLPGRQPEI